MTIAPSELRKMSDSELQLLADEIKYVREWRKYSQNIADGTDEAQERDYRQRTIAAAIEFAKTQDKTTPSAAGEKTMPYYDKEPDWVLVRELGTRLGNILVLKHHHTVGIPFNHLKQLRRMVFAYGEAFIEKDFSEWCDTPDAARAATTKYPTNSYFKTFDTRILALREDVPASPTAEKIKPRDTKLEEATRWLEFTLQDGQPRPSKALFESARNAVPCIRRETLERAYAGMPGHVKPFLQCGKWFWQLRPERAASEEWDFTEEGKRTVRSAEFSQIIYNMLAPDIASGMTKERLWFNFVHTVAWVASGHNFERSITPEDLKALMQWTNRHSNEWRPITEELWATFLSNNATDLERRAENAGAVA